jgi:hypothetical protein
MVAAIGLAAAAPAQAAPPTLTGETFHEDLPTLTAVDCAAQRISYTSTGTATGPYPGSYFESGTVTADSPRLHATFTIYSTAGIVTGTKEGGAGFGCASGTVCNSAQECDREGASFNTLPDGFTEGDTYSATIYVPRRGRYGETGLFRDRFYHSEDHDSPNDGFDSSFQSALGSPVFTGPYTLQDCRNGAHTSFGFNDQASCLEAVRTAGRQACLFEKVAHGTPAFRAKYGTGPQHEHAMSNCVHGRIGF